MTRLAVALLLFALACTGCAARRPVPRTVKLAVLDGYTMFEVAKGDELTEEGWWFNQRDVLQSNNAGVLASEALAREFGRIPGVEVYSRMDLITYIASKERLIRKEYPKLTPEDRTELLALQSPYDYGRSLGVDYVLVPRVPQSATVQHGVSSFWSSRAEIEVDLWETETGQMVWSWRGKDRDYFDSQFRIMEELARKAAARARKKRVFE